MKFAKFPQILTACSFIFLAGCQSLPPVEFNRSEAVKARINLALAYLEQQDFPKAKENIDKALSHDSNDYLPHSVLGYYFQQIGEIQQANSAYQTALYLSQNRPDVLNNYGTFLCKQGQYTSAYTHFEQALQSEQPYYHQADTLANIILCANKEGNLEKKITAEQQLKKYRPK